MSNAQQGLNDFRGDNLSVRMFGAKGDTQNSQVITTNLSKTVNWAGGPKFQAGDVGKNIFIYGAAGSGPQVLINASVTGVASTGSLTPVLSLDTFGVATKIGVAGNCTLNGVTWSVYGSNTSGFISETLVHGPTALAVATASDSYVQTPPTFRYYRIKIQSTGGSPGTFYGTMIAVGFVYGGTIAAYVSATQITLSTVAGATSTNCSFQAIFGTDDTVAIQTAINYANSITNPSTSADGGTRVNIPTGRYMLSAAITHKKNVVMKGQSAAATIFYVDPTRFPANTPVWNMTGTFPSDQQIAFFTRLEDVRIDCCHTPGSIAVFCDALQEHSGLIRVQGINWMQYGILAGTNTDQFGNANWKLVDPYFYPSTAAFLDNTVRAFYGNYSISTTVERSTMMAQGGFICGFGICWDVNNGTLNLIGQNHVESAKIGVHYDTGSTGVVEHLDAQSFVLNNVIIDTGNPVVLQDIQTINMGVNIQDNTQSNTITQQIVSRYVSLPANVVEYIAGALMITSGFPGLGPNVITLDSVNFGGPTQGGFIGVNSRSGVFPNWQKTSSNASNSAMWLRLAAAMFEVMIGTAANANGTQPGTSYLQVTTNGLQTPRLYFADVGSGNPMGFGNTLGLNQFRWRHGDTGQSSLHLEYSTDVGATWHDFATFNAALGTITLTGFSGGVTQLNGLTGSLSITNGGAISIAPSGTNVALAVSEPAWTAYSPSTTNLTSVTINLARGIQLGKTAKVRIKLVGTSNGSVPTVTLPYANFDAFEAFVVVVLDQTAGNYLPAICTIGGTSTLQIILTGGVSFTNAHVIQFWIDGTYETT